MLFKSNKALERKLKDIEKSESQYRKWWNEEVDCSVRKTKQINNYLEEIKKLKAELLIEKTINNILKEKFTNTVKSNKPIRKVRSWNIKPLAFYTRGKPDAFTERGQFIITYLRKM